MKIRKNTQEFNEVLNSTTGWSVCCLESFFRAEPVEDCKFDDFDLKHGRLRKEGNEYIFSIHSNLWYKKAIN